jgi:hypothetical protein
MKIRRRSVGSFMLQQTIKVIAKRHMALRTSFAADTAAQHGASAFLSIAVVNLIADADSAGQDLLHSHWPSAIGQSFARNECMKAFHSVRLDVRHGLRGSCREAHRESA